MADYTTQDQKLEAGGLFDPRFSKDMTTAERIHLVMTRVDYVQKDKGKESDEPGAKKLKYSIVSHDKVTGLVRQHTVACGLIYWPHSMETKRDGNMTEVKLSLTFRSIHDADDEITVDGLGYGIDTGDKGPGKAISYAVKYALLKAFGLETGDDPDQDQEVTRRSTASQRADGLVKNIGDAVNAKALKDILIDPTTDNISQALRRDDPKAWQDMNRAVMTKAKALGLDLRTMTIVDDKTE